MNWIAPRFLRPAKLTSVQPPAVVLPLDRYNGRFIVAGAGEEVYACFIGDDPTHRFEAFRLSLASNWKGLAVEAVEIEVDLASAQSLDGNYLTAGSVVRNGTDLHLIARVKEGGGFRELRRIPIASNFPSADDGEGVAFLRWRAVIRDNDTIIPIADVAVEAATKPE